MVGMISGIVSGMDTQSIVSQLMQLERQPQLRLQSQKAALEKLISTYRSLNTKVSSIGDATKALTGLNGWTLAKATSSDPTRVAVTATAGAATTSFTFAVKSLATAASAISSGSVSSPDTVVTDGPLLLTSGTAALGFSSVVAGSSLAVGEHTLAVTAGSQAAALSGSTAVPAAVTVTNDQNTLNLTVDGVARTVTLTAGTYTPDSLTTELQSKLGTGVTASLGTDGRLSLTGTTTGSAASLSVTGGSNQLLTSLGLTVGASATGTDPLVELDGQPTTVTRSGDQLTITNGTGDSVVGTLAAGGAQVGEATVDMVSGTTGGRSLGQVVNDINASGGDVTAAAIQTSPGVYRLQLTSKGTGAASAFSLDGTAFPSSLSGLGTMQVVNAGSDAVLSVGGGTGAYEITRPSNTITDLFKGVTLTLAKADPATQVTVDVERDTDGLADQAQKLVDALNSTLTEISTLTEYDPATKKAGALVGDSMLRRIRSSLVEAVSWQTSVVSAVDGSTLTAGSVGIELQRDGTFTLDKATFLEAYAKDPAAVEALLGKGTEAAPGIAGRVENEVDRITDRVDGLIPGTIKSKESQIRGYTDRISSWDSRLELRQLTLQRQFTAMEKALGAAQSQGQWLAGQIAGLPSWGA